MKTKFLESNRGFREYYEKLLEVFAYADQYGTCIDTLEGKFFNIYPRMLRAIETEEEKAFVNACAQEIADCYQKRLKEIITR